MTADERLIDHVALVVAAAGTELRIDSGAGGRLAGGDAHELVLLGADRLEQLDGAPGPFRGAGDAVLVGWAGDQERLWRAAAAHPGTRVAVLPDASAWLGEFLGERGLRGGAGTVLAFAGAVGGAGTTTVALLAASTAVRSGRSTLLIDADPASGGIGHRLGMGSRGLRPPEPGGGHGQARASGLAWDDIASADGRLPPHQLADVLPSTGGLSFLTWSAARSPESPERAEPVSAGVLSEVVASARQAYDVVVLDSGRAGPGPLAGHAWGAPDAAVCVVPGDRPWSLTALPTELAWLALVTGRLPSGHDAFTVAAEAGMPLLTYVPPLRTIRRASADGAVLELGRHRVTARAMAPVAALWERGREPEAAA
ncbi:secretion/DNA translocation related CpaE-like protein [Zhihengliuella halotolerans]|uniref:Secretion/DNA translocation related CpaE-like protein n=1 Tax=Zhihengliuella halotolerans TaxID=370736 RepID=A0A4Q8ADN9_9MICC|nr:secretion/DNA translocation related CpaE-like protein [Zhihengliuella halotolerans]